MLYELNKGALVNLKTDREQILIIEEIIIRCKKDDDTFVEYPIGQLDLGLQPHKNKAVGIKNEK
jgi:hypothetical protein